MKFGGSAERLHQRFKDAGAVLNVIDIGGLRIGGDASTRAPRNAGQPPAILFHAALQTGGTVMHGSGVENNLRMFFEGRRVTYLLGVRPPQNERESNEIRVAVRNQPPLTEVAYRRGYSTSRGNDGVTGLLLADMLMNDIRRGDVTTELRVASDGGLTVEVGVPSEEILTHATDGSVTVDVFVYLFDPAGRIVDSRYRRMKLDAAKAREALDGAQIVRRERFTVDPGPYTVKTLVHVIGDDLVGFARKDVEVPAGSAPASAAAAVASARSVH